MKRRIEKGVEEVEKSNRMKKWVAKIEFFILNFLLSLKMKSRGRLFKI